MVQGGEQWPRGKQQTLLDLGTAQIPESSRRKEGSLLSQARSVLALTSAPVTMPCREAEREGIATFVKEVVQAGKLNAQFFPHFYAGNCRECSLLMLLPSSRWSLSQRFLSH